MRIAPLVLSAALLLPAPLIAQSAPKTYVSAQDQAAYEADMAAYRDAVAATDQANQMSADLAARQQRAYADAMHAWRLQVVDCNRGIIAACRAPTPRPGDFMR